MNEKRILLHLTEICTKLIGLMKMKLGQAKQIVSSDKYLEDYMNYI